MIYAFLGTDRTKIHTKAHAWITVARSKQPGLTYTRITEEDFSKEILLEQLSGSSLFVQKLLIAFSEVGELGREVLLEHLQDLSESENVFVIIDSAFSKKEQDLISARAVKTFTFDSVSEGPDWSLFAVGGALARGDLKSAWVSYIEKRREGVEAEVLAGIIHAKIRKLLAEKGSQPWQGYSRYFLDLYHSARRGEVELDEAVEYFLLTCEKTCPPTRTRT